MLAQVVLIADVRKELSQKYKKILQANQMIKVMTSNDLDTFFELTEKYEPELILITDNFEMPISEICKKIRKSLNTYRPVIVILSKSSYLQDKMDALISGADDFLSEPIESEELYIRILAHLRRQLEELSDSVTLMPLPNITNKTIKRTISFKEKWSLLYIDIENYSYYQEIYGIIAAEKILKTFIAITKSILEPNDFIGYIKENHFVIITNPIKAERLAEFLTFAFDKVASRFYNKEDIERGYLIVSGSNKAGRRISFVNLKIGVVSNNYKEYNYIEALNKVKEMCKLAKQKEGSFFVCNKPKICTEDTSYKENSRKIVIIEPDAALAYLLTTTLEMQGYTTYALTLSDDTIDNIRKVEPQIIILDTSENNFDLSIKLCEFIKSDNQLSNIKIIVTATIHEKERILNCGADVYLPKPYELVALYKWINQLIY